MYLGINFEQYNILNILDPSTGNYDSTYDIILTGGSTSESYSFSIDKVYEIPVELFPTLILSQPKKGQSLHLKIKVPNGSGGLTDAYAWCQTDGVNIQREGSPITRDSVTYIQVRVTLNLTLVTLPNAQTYTYPWDLPPYNFKIGTELLQQSAWDFFCTEDQSPQNWARKPFVNTAGVPLQAEVTRPLVRMSFSFNLYDIEPDWVYKWTGKVNNDRVEICGIWFDPGTVKLDSLNFETCTDSIPPSQEGGEPTEIYYYKCDVSLLIDPQTYERQYLNVGVHIRDANGNLRRLWTANNNGTIVFGSIDSVIGYQNPEEVTDNMFINAAGTAVSGIDPNTQRQTPTYRKGYLEELCSFAEIGLPDKAPFYQIVTPRPEEEA